IGTDLVAPGWFAKGLRGYSDFPALAEGLARRVCSAPEIAGIMGQNYVRTLGA
ncbi:membrane dipeptidase, partial [Myxococcota bacterium]|nr:membrane dipeptidase [Myxococcota bacterium]